MDAAGRPLGHPYGMPVVPAANMALYPTLGQQFRPSAGQVQYGLPPPFPFHPPSYLSPTPPVHLPPVPAPAPAPGKGFISSLETTPSPVPPPLDFELENRIEKLVEYVAKNGPQFETLMKEKQIGNPAYAFLFGAEGHSYYRHRLWLHVNGHVNSSSAPQAAASLPTLNSYTPPPLHAGLRGPSPVSVSALNPQTMPPLNLASANTPAPLTSFPLRLENARPQHLPLQQMQPVSSSFEQPQTDTGDGASKDESFPLFRRWSIHRSFSLYLVAFSASVLLAIVISNSILWHPWQQRPCLSRLSVASDLNHALHQLLDPLSNFPEQLRFAELRWMFSPELERPSLQRQLLEFCWQALQMLPP